MTKLDRLKRTAREDATARGHSLARFRVHHYWGRVHYACCSQCGMQVVVTAKPAPNEIDIGGEAVALDCKGSS